MKLTSSSSVSSSTSTNLGATFPTSKSSVFGFFSFVLSRILCSRSLPTHPSDQLKETDPFENHDQHSMKSQKADDSATPSLVARLMGLDSMPEIDTQKDFASTTRSKSMNSVHFRFEEAEKMQGQHRRVKTSVSFPETPLFFELEDDDFLTLNFENGDRNRKPRSKKVKPEVGGRGNEQKRRRRRERVQSRESDRGMSKEQGRRHSFKISEGNSKVFALHMENSDEVRERNRKKKKENCLDDPQVEVETEPENSSPVSVLEHSLFISDHEVPTLEEETRNRSSSPRRKLSSELSKLGHPSYDHDNGNCPKGNDQESNEANMKDYQRHKNVEMMNQICRLAEAEMVDFEWKCKSGLVGNLKNWEVEIGVELGLQIVDQLVYEVVHLLWELR